MSSGETLHFGFFVMTRHLLRFVRVAQLPDELEMLLDEQRLGVSVAHAVMAFFFFS